MFSSLVDKAFAATASICRATYLTTCIGSGRRRFESYLNIGQFKCLSNFGRSRAFNDYVIEGLLAFSVWFIHKLGDLVRTAQAGYLPFYLGTLIVGVLLWRFFGQLPL